MTILAVAVGGAIVKLCLWIGGMNTFKDNTEDILKVIQKDIKKILGRLLPDTVKEGSPLILTDKGRIISQELEIVSWAETTAKGLSERIRGETTI